MDYSHTSTTWSTATTPGTELSPGAARGPILIIEDSADLTRLSVAPIVSIAGTAAVPESRYVTALLDRLGRYPSPPVVYAATPYVILARLIGHVAGFVFAGGSTLCHLAILLREANIPAVVANLDAIADGCIATIDNGVLHLTTQPTT